MKFSQFLAESKKEKEKKIVFKETDGRSAFPDNTIKALKKEITSYAKDLKKEWKSTSELIKAVYQELEIPEPQAYQKERWEQQTDLIGFAIKQLYASRGAKASVFQSI